MGHISIGKWNPMVQRQSCLKFILRDTLRTLKGQAHYKQIGNGNIIDLQGMIKQFQKCMNEVTERN